MTFNEIMWIVAIVAIIAAINLRRYMVNRDGAWHSDLTGDTMFRYVKGERQERKKTPEEHQEDEAAKAW